MMEAEVDTLSQRPARHTHQNGAVGDMEGLHRTACISCRTLRQRCNRQMPCDRCVIHQRSCRFPAKSNRGRKQGSTNKPETVEKLLARIRDSPVHDQVVAALMQSTERQTQISDASLQTPQSEANASNTTSSDYGFSATSYRDQPARSEHEDFRPPCGDMAEQRRGTTAFISPLHILAAAVDTEGASRSSSPYSITPASNFSSSCRPTTLLVDRQVAKYFSRQLSYKRDWDSLATQPNNSPLKLEPSACDPVTARLVDQDDVCHYFHLFFTVRNPLIGLLDANFHSPEYVYGASFTLFSAICALGCAISTRPRDQLLYPTLYSVAEAAMKWSIAASVRSLETIQAIVIMQYWAPVSVRQLEDPYWLFLNHATQLAREMGIGRPSCVKMHVQNLAEGRSEEFRMRLVRNFERTWLYIFVADKSFGIITGRSLRVSWKDMPDNAGNWWQESHTIPLDRMVSGIVAMRRALLEANESSLDRDNSTASIAAWHDRAFERLNQLRVESVTSDSPEYTTPLRILGFYHDHSILVLNAQALRDILATGANPAAAEAVEISRKTIQIACRFIDTMLSDQILVELQFGFHNNLFIMICHAATEILQAIKRGGQSVTDVEKASPKLKAIPRHLEKIARGLPTSSHAPLYLSLSRFFVEQLDEANPALDSNTLFSNVLTQDDGSGEVWALGDGSVLDPAVWLDMGFLTSSQQPGIGGADSSLSAASFNDFTYQRADAL